MTAIDHGRLLDGMLVAARARFRDADRAWDPARPGVEALPDHGRALLDSYAAALHVLWTYQDAWADEGFVSRCRLPGSGQRLLELVGLQPDPGAAATGLQSVRCVQGREGTVPPGFAVRAPAAAGAPAQTYETLRARRVSWRLNELRPFLPPAAGDQGSEPAPGAVSAVVVPPPGTSTAGDSPFGVPSTAAALIDRLQAARAGSLAQRQAAQARQTALRLADLARVVAPASDGACCNDGFAQLCRELGAAAAVAGPTPPEPGPLSQSQETLLGVLARLAVAEPSGLDALDAALGRCAGEDDAAYSARLDQLAAFLDLLVGGLLQHARDQVVLLHGPGALQQIDDQVAGDSARGVAQPGTDGLYLLPDADGDHTGLLSPGDWLVLGTDEAGGARDAVAGRVRGFFEAVQVVRVRQETPPELSEPATLVTFHPPLRRRYRLADTVVLGNVLQISHGRTVRESGLVDAAGGRFLTPAQGPLTWLRDPSPLATEGRRAELGLRSGGRDWQQVPDLAGHTGVEPVFAVEARPNAQSRVGVGDDQEAASLPPGAAYTLEYRVGIGVIGDQVAGAVRDLASTHPAVLDTSNPLPIGGGADPEPFERTRVRARAGLHALQRAVSAQDVASLATTFGGVAQATLVPGLPGRRRLLQLVVCGDQGAELDQSECAQLRSFLIARMPPGTGVQVRNRTLLPVRAAIRLMVAPGDDPLAVLNAAAVRLGARRAEGVEVGLLDPGAAVLGRALDVSDLYRALDGLPGLAAAVVTALYRADQPAQRHDRVAASEADLLVWAQTGAGAEALELSWAELVDQ